MATFLQKQYLGMTESWRVEKYVYGKLKETIEAPMGTAISFASIKSGYSDDTFYGWSISPTSTTRTFTSSSRSNTDSTVKKYLDSNNVLKIYAIYMYTVTTAEYKTFEDYAYGGSSSGYRYPSVTKTAAKSGYATVVFSTWHNRGSSYFNNGTGATNEAYIKVNGSYINPPSGVTSSTQEVPLYKGDTIEATGIVYLSSSDMWYGIKLTIYQDSSNTYYRVVSH